jgi:hypothetical protein
VGFGRWRIDVGCFQQVPNLTCQVESIADRLCSNNSNLLPSIYQYRPSNPNPNYPNHSHVLHVTVTSRDGHGHDDDIDVTDDADCTTRSCEQTPQFPFPWDPCKSESSIAGSVWVGRSVRGLLYLLDCESRTFGFLAMRGSARDSLQQTNHWKEPIAAHCHAIRRTIRGSIRTSLGWSEITGGRISQAWSSCLREAETLGRWAVDLKVAGAVALSAFFFGDFRASNIRVEREKDRRLLFQTRSKRTSQQSKAHCARQLVHQQIMAAAAEGYSSLAGTKNIDFAKPLDLSVLKNRVALVTDGAAGIGLGVVKALAQAGA